MASLDEKTIEQCNSAILDANHEDLVKIFDGVNIDGIKNAIAREKEFNKMLDTISELPAKKIRRMIEKLIELLSPEEEYDLIAYFDQKYPIKIRSKTAYRDAPCINEDGLCLD
jgi:hypothetical protein